MQKTKKTDENNIADSAVAPLSLRCCAAINPLSICCCCSCCRYAVASDIASAVAPLSLRCCSSASSVPPLPLLFLLLLLHCHCCYLSCCHSTVTPDVGLLSLLCRSAVSPLSFRYQSAVAPLLLRCRCCHCCCQSSYRSCCHSTAVAWIFHFRRLKRNNQGNGFHR